MDSLLKNKAVIDNIGEYYDVISSADDPKFIEILKNVKNI